MSVRWLLSVVGLSLVSACGHASRAALFSSAPSFELTVQTRRKGALLVPTNVNPDLLESEDCEGGSESCEPDWFVGFVFYRSEDGAYGAYDLLSEPQEVDFLDETWDRSEAAAWRAVVVRDGEEDGLRVEAVSTAAQLAED